MYILYTVCIYEFIKPLRQVHIMNRSIDIPVSRVLQLVLTNTASDDVEIWSDNSDPLYRYYVFLRGVNQDTIAEFRPVDGLFRVMVDKEQDIFHEYYLRYIQGHYQIMDLECNQIDQSFCVLHDRRVRRCKP